MARDYKDEYRKFQSSRKQKKMRAERNRARRKAMRNGSVSKGDGYDMSHTSNGFVKKKASVNRGSKTDMPGDRKARGGGKKKRIRQMRGDSYVQEGKERASHKMTYSSSDKKYDVYPTLFPKKKNPSTSSKDWVEKSDKNNWAAYEEAKKRGEVVTFKRKKRAEKVAAGSWKKGDDRKEAIKNYREKKKRYARNK